MHPYAFGVDVGGTTVKMGLFSHDGALLDKWEIPTRTQNNGENVLPDVVESIRSKLSEKNIAPQNVEGIGIGVPGPVSADFTVHECVNLGWGVFNLKEKMNQLLPEIPNVAAGNDANVATLGELWQGGGKVWIAQHNGLTADRERVFLAWRWLCKVFICGGKRHGFFFGQVFKGDFPLPL